MTDLGPMRRCYRKKAHHFAFVIPSSRKDDLTLACEKCGSIRRIPVNGDMVPLDAMSSDEIMRRIGVVPHG